MNAKKAYEEMLAELRKQEAREREAEGERETDKMMGRYKGAFGSGARRARVTQRRVSGMDERIADERVALKWCDAMGEEYEVTADHGKLLLDAGQAAELYIKLEAEFKSGLLASRAAKFYETILKNKRQTLEKHQEAVDLTQALVDKYKQK